MSCVEAAITRWPLRARPYIELWRFRIPVSQVVGETAVKYVNNIRSFHELCNYHHDLQYSKRCSPARSSHILQWFAARPVSQRNQLNTHPGVYYIQYRTRNTTNIALQISTTYILSGSSDISVLCQKTQTIQKWRHKRGATYH